jgi:hypothetical protein
VLLPGTISRFPRDIFGQGKLHGKMPCSASSSRLRASGPIFVSAWRSLA